jgi:hypothetical protein
LFRNVGGQAVRVAVRAIVWCSIITASLLAPATRAGEKWASVGAGVTTCAKYGHFIKQYPDSSLYFFWAQGYLSALNVHMKLTGQPFTDYKAISTDEQERVVMSYCDKHPLALYVDAVEFLFDEIWRQQALPPWVRPQASY